jgi:DnaJ domain
MTGDMDRIPDRVTQKLNDMLKGEDLAKLYMFLARNANNPQFQQVLENTVDDDSAFRATVNMMLEDMKKFEADGSYGQVMADVWNALMPFSDNSGETPHFDFTAALAHPETCRNVAVCNMIAMIAKIPPESQVRMLQVACNMSRVVLGESWAVAIRDGVSNSLQTFRGVAGKVVPVVLVGVYLAYDVISNMRRWWKGEISGRRCAKNIIDNGIGLAAGIGGGVGGAAIGTLVFPVLGTIIGGLVGGIVATELAKRVSDWFTQKIFDLPQSEALENAFRVLGVHHDATNSEINTEFRRLCLKHHPDKGGDVEDFHKLQYAMQVIKMSREV